jgi:hypothetical protein
MFRDCGGFPHLLSAIVLEFRKDRLSFLEKGTLSDDHALIIFTAALENVRNVYGPGRWHNVISANHSLEDNNRVVQRASWPITQVVMKRILLLALTKLPVHESGRVLEKDGRSVALLDCRDSGMIDLVEDGKSRYVSLALIPMILLNSMSTTIPEVAHVENPFNDDWRH